MIVIPGIAALVLAALAGTPAAPAAPAAAGDASDRAEMLDAPARLPSRVWLGVFIENAVDGGVQVVDVVPGGPAARAGLTRGDVLIRAGSADLATMLDLRKVVEGLAPGDDVSLVVLRKGSPQTAHLILGTPPPPGWALPQPVPPPAAPPAPPFAPGAGGGPGSWRALGLTVERIPPPLREHLGGPAEAGVLVTRVDPAGPAAGRVRVGDLLVQAEGKALEDPAAIEGILALAPSGRLGLSGVRDGAPFAAEVPLRGAGPGADGRRERIRVLEMSIRELQATLDAMKKELAALKSAP